MQEQIRQSIEQLVSNGINDFVIYPYGKYGKFVKTILNEEFGLYERYIVDNKLFDRDKNIYDVEYLREDYYHDDNFTILLVVDPAAWSVSLAVHQQISFAKVERIVDILSYSTYFCPWNHFSAIRTLKWPKIALIECISREIYRNGIKGAVAEAGVFKGRQQDLLTVCSQTGTCFYLILLQGLMK